MLRKMIYATLCVAGIMAAAPCQATVVSTITAMPGSIPIGGTVLLDGTISSVTDPGFVGSFFTGGSITLSDGAGDSQSFAVTGGITFEAFIQNFAPSVAGSFTASISGSVSQEELFQSCSLFGGCITAPEFFSFTVGQGVPLQVTSTVPEPSTLAIIAIGLAGLGWLRRRHKTS